MRLRKVDGPAHLKAAFVTRTSRHELEFSHLRRWSEEPPAYLRRTLGQALFEQRALERAHGDADAALDVELLAFELVLAPRPRARVRATLRLSDGQTSLEESFRAEQRLQGDPTSGAALAEAMGIALEKISQTMAARVLFVMQASRQAQ